MGVETVAVEALNTKPGLSLSMESMHIEVTFAGKKKVTQIEFWPRGIRFSGWRRFTDHKQQPSYSRNCMGIRLLVTSSYIFV